MGFRFRKSIKIAPGISLNIGKKGISASIGPRGAKVTVGSRGTRATLGIPGTGMSFTATGKQISKSLRPQAATSTFLKECPYCGRRMRKRWEECPQCGRELPQPDLPTQQPQPVITEKFDSEISLPPLNESEEIIVKEITPEPVIPPAPVDPHSDNDFNTFYETLELFRSHTNKICGYEYAKKLFAIFRQLTSTKKNDQFLEEQLDETWLFDLLLSAIATNDVRILTSAPQYLTELYFEKDHRKNEIITLANDANSLATKLKEYIFDLNVSYKMTEDEFIKNLNRIVPYPKEIFILLVTYDILEKYPSAEGIEKNLYHKRKLNLLSKQSLNFISHKFNSLWEKLNKQ